MNDRSHSVASVDLWVQNANSSRNSNDYQHGRDQQSQQSYQEQYDPQHGNRYSGSSGGGVPPEYGGDQQNYDDWQGQGGSQQEIHFDNSLPDIQLLAHFCSQAHPPNGNSEEDLMVADESWDPVRDWLRTHSAEDVYAAAGQRDETGKTAIHIACQNAPPDDIIDVFLSIASDVIQWPDQFGWLAIHYACAYGASGNVIKGLAEAYPESKTTVDRKGRTPLHFALGTNNPHTAAVIVILSSTGAAEYEDDNGMLPLHYACAYGASEDCLYVLTGTYHGAITHMDRRGRTPLHFTLSNAGRPAAPSAVRLLLGLNRNLVNSRVGSPSPFRVLAEFATTVKPHQTQERESCKACLRTMLAANPTPTADFFTALLSLPDFLRELAVVMKVVQELLNIKIAQRFPTLILMLDFYVQMMVVTFYSIAVQDSVDKRFETDPENPTIGLKLTLPLYVGASYFFLRELINFLSMLSLGAFKSWAFEPSSWLNIWYVFVIYFWAYHMTEGTLDKNFFRTGSAISFAFIWTKFLSYLRNMLIDFAVFVAGVFHVMRRLAAFLICLTIILVAFSQMWTALFEGTAFCGSENPAANLTEAERIAAQQCEDWNINSWCDPWDSFLKTYTMLLGNVDEGDFDDNTLATILFVLFMFLVVILLKNVLIAVVIDSYKAIQDHRAAIVFWTNRLYFIAQMDAIANGPWKALLREAMGLEDPDLLEPTGLTNVFGKSFWKRLMDMFEEDFQEGVLSIQFYLNTVMRIGALFVVIPSWIVLGICTGGWLWPPQIRVFVFTSTVTKHNSESEREEELRRNQLVKLKAEIESLGEAIRQELALDRSQVAQTRSIVTNRKVEIQAEMKHIKRIVTMLFEQVGGG